MKSRKKVLVTGSEGQLGRTLQDMFLDNRLGLDFTFASKKTLDVTKAGQVRSYLDENQFDFCINCAAYTNVDKAEEDENAAFEVNCQGVKNLVDGLAGTEAILIHLSTDYVFDGSKRSPYTETDTPGPINVYGRSKLAGEALITRDLKDYFIVRSSWLYSKYGKNFLKSIVRKIKSGENIDVVSTQTGVPTACPELASFIMTLMTDDGIPYGLYHFCPDGESTWYDFAIEISKNLGDKDPAHRIAPVANYSQKALRPHYSVLNNEKAKTIYTGMEPWQKGVSNVLTSMAIGKDS